VIGGVIGAMVMSLLVLRVLYLFFDWLAHGAFWVLTRVFRVSEATASGMLGLNPEQSRDDDDGVEGGSRNGSVGASTQLTPV
jgi:cobalt-zinc-cadmium resistance protein CzcA